MAFDQGDEVLGGSGRGPSGEVGVSRAKVVGPARRLVKLQRPPPEMRIFSPSFGVVDDHHGVRAPGGGGADQAGCAAADHEDIELQLRKRNDGAAQGPTGDNTMPGTVRRKHEAPRISEASCLK